MYVPDMIELVAHLKTCGALGRITNVLEVGAQEIFASGFETSMERFIKAFRPEAKISEACLTALSYGPARDLYRFIGCNYSCVDVIKDPDHRFYRKLLDLNFDEVPTTERKRYDFVTNLGVSHHLLNQYSSFKAIHDFTAANGFIFHYLPFMGRYDDLYFYHEPSLFYHLAKTNDYDLIGVWVYIPGDHLSPRSFFPWDDRLWNYIRIPLDTPNRYYVLTALFRKKETNDFRAPSIYKLGVEGSRPIISHANFRLLSDLLKSSTSENGRVKRVMELSDSALAAKDDVGETTPSEGGLFSQEGVVPEETDKCTFSRLRNLFESFGWEYARLQPVGNDPIDFDNYKVSSDERGTYNLVCNYGVSQNILNQLNFFEMVHDFTTVSGHMIHIVPFMGFSTQAYFCYETSFFEELAYANGYERVGCWLNLSGGLIPLTESIYEWIRVPEDDHKELLWICAVLRKRHDQDFAIPFQSFYSSVRDEAIAKRYVGLKSGRSIPEDMQPWIPKRERMNAETRRRKQVTDPPRHFSEQGYDRDRIIRDGFFQAYRISKSTVKSKKYNHNNFV